MKNQSRCFASAKPERSPFARAKQMWDQRLGSARLQAFNWRIMAMASMALSLMLGFGLIYLAGQTQVETYVIEVNPDGRPGRIELINNAYSPTAAQVGYHVAELVKKVRSRPTDPVVLKRQWQEAYHYLAGDAVSAMNQFAARAELFDPAKQDTAVSVQIEHVIQKSDGSFQVRWKEALYRNGVESGVTHWTGIFTTQIEPPSTATAVYANPLGVFVTSFSWAQEVSLQN